MTKQLSFDDLVGLVDMGSNGIRFSISNMSPPTTRIMPTVFQDRCGVSLYDAQYSTGKRAPIPDDVIQEVLSALLRFKRVCKEFAVPNNKIRIVATEATRTALNSNEFRSAIEQGTGWKVEMLAKEEEGRVGALGVASSFSSLSGLAMDLGGGSVQLTWIIAEGGKIQIHPRGSISLPYGAAALKRLLEDAEPEGDSQVTQLQEKLGTDLKQAIEDLAIPSSIMNAARHNGGLKLYLSGGGFRGWGYLLMDTHSIQPYPISLINGFEVPKSAFVPSETIEASAESTPFRVSSRRASQVPAVSLLIKTLVAVLPSVSTVHFAQGGLREGLLFSDLSDDVRSQHPLVAATAPYAPISADAMIQLLKTGLPPSRSPDPARSLPHFLTDTAYLAAVINLSYLQASHSKDIQSAAALRCTTTGVLASAHGLAHMDRALVALTLCQRWGGDISPGDVPFHQGLEKLVGAERAWWAKYLGTLAGAIGATYPSGRIAEQRLRLTTQWKYKDEDYGLKVKIDLMKVDNDSGPEPTWITDLEKLGKPKHCVEGFGLRVRAKVEWI